MLEHTHLIWLIQRWINRKARAPEHGLRILSPISYTEIVLGRDLFTASRERQMLHHQSTHNKHSNNPNDYFNIFFQEQQLTVVDLTNHLI